MTMPGDGAQGRASEVAGFVPPSGLLHLYFDFAPDGHVLTDRQGIIIEANYATATLFNCGREFLLDKPLGLFIATGHRTRFYESLSRLRRSANTDEFESRVGRHDELRQVVLRVSVGYPAFGDEAAYLWLIRDITERRRVELARDELMRRVVTAQEDERGRLARELHDSIGQLLSALALSVKTVRNSGDLPSQATASLNDIQGIADQLGRAAHDIAIQLRPTVLDDVGLHTALQHFLEDWTVRTGIQLDFQSVGIESRRFPTDVETALYRVIQESLTNVVKHARARVVSVVVERHNECAIVMVEDDGIGFEVDQSVTYQCLGLLGMKERMFLLGGTLVVESQPRAGTTIIGRIPLVGNARLDDRKSP